MVHSKRGDYHLLELKGKLTLTTAQQKKIGHQRCQLLKKGGSELKGHIRTFFGFLAVLNILGRLKR